MAQAEARPDGFGNSALWVAAHLVRARHGLLARLGAELPNPLPAELVNAKGIADVTAWPALDEVRAAWTGVSHALRDRLDAVTPAELAAAIDVRFPVFEQTVYGALVFLVQHDSYHIGQLSVLRKLVGLPGMSFR